MQSMRKSREIYHKYVTFKKEATKCGCPTWSALVEQCSTQFHSSFQRWRMLTTPIRSYHLIDHFYLILSSPNPRQNWIFCAGGKYHSTGVDRLRLQRRVAWGNLDHPCANGECLHSHFTALWRESFQLDEERRYLGFAVALEEMWSRKGLHEAIRDNLRTPLRKFGLFIRSVIDKSLDLEKFREEMTQ